jgi:tetratricopeptide (TPR) repeat protein
VYFERYAKANPENTKSFTEIGGVYDVLGEYDQAATYYEKALLLDPENVSVLRAIADIDAKLGRSDIALKKYNDALRMARSARDRIEIYSGLQEFYLNRGELEKSFEQMRLKWDEYKSVYTPVQLMIRKSLDARLLIKAKRPDEAFAIIESVRKEMQHPYDELVPLGYVYAYLELEEADSAEAALKRLMPFIDAYRVEQLRGNVYFAEGRIAEIRGDYRKAIERFEKEAAATPTDPAVHLYIGRCQRKLGEYEKASTSLTKTLKVLPNDPDVLYELALLRADQGKRTEALESLQKALSVWENADPVFKPAREARETLARWTS